MPRPLKSAPNALRQLRSITGLSQQAFASLTGLSAETIKSVETRLKKTKKALSADSAGRIAKVTGVSPQCLIDNTPLLTHAGSPYTAHVWATWKASTSFPPQDVRRAADLMGKRLAALVCAADADGRFLPALAAIQELIGSVLSTRKCKLAYAQCLRAATTHKRILRCTVGELRHDREAAQEVGFRDSKRFCSMAAVEIRELKFVRERELPGKIECEEDGIHYAFDWYALRTVYEGTIEGKHPWKHETETFNYLHAPVAPETLTYKSARN